MAEQTVDVVVDKLGIDAPCTTADEVLPDQHERRDVLARPPARRHRARRAAATRTSLCECELVTRPMAEAYLDRHWPCTIDDVRRGTRVGMGPCQGAFCTFRVAGLIAERLDRPRTATPPPTGRLRAAEHAAIADRALTDFLRGAVQGHRGRSRMGGSSRSC